MCLSMVSYLTLPTTWLVLSYCVTSGGFIRNLLVFVSEFACECIGED